MNPLQQALSAALEYVIVSRQVSEHQAAVGFLYREMPAFEQDSGWRIFSGTEGDDFIDDVTNFDTMLLSKVLQLYPEIVPLMNQAAGAWAWSDETEQFVVVDDWQSENE